MRYEELSEWLDWQESLHPKSIDLGLTRVAGVHKKLHPGYEPPITLSVAGTNGKGSSVAMLEAILREQGYRTGVYTSPHLQVYNERIRIDGNMADDAALCATFDRIDQARADVTLSFFEFGTLAALDIFARERVDVQILEVGLGGRLDAVNILDADAALITSIGVDHVDWLGSTRDMIAMEKAGIFRPGKPAIVGDPNPPACLCSHAGVSLLGRDFGYELSGSVWNWRGLGAALDRLAWPAIPGRHQFMNAAAAIQMLRSLADLLPVSDQAIRNGLKNVRLPGRFQYFGGGSIPVLLDVAHNPQSAAALAGYLQEQFPGKTIRAVFSVMRDKDIHGIVDAVRGVVACWYLAPLKLDRAARGGDLSRLMQGMGVESIRNGYKTVAEAVGAAFSDAQPDDLIVVFGSFFLASEFLALDLQSGLISGSV
ncbi:bifunctional tetrahydrofolate synthase/dihydrofolate synthase [Candidatus Methylospira mobilis]|uniref:Dihydrofolate synthase/folylpolyglutamate synthase n=1 Tax=Candidatus Methylospira mobilis TaxID=1808979 RepID=A0A5Q0BK44_9GAMM|nr:bifunctional tetrahydrofolate synthase/dihydrofolate synthase [Candidatus Methylospira mobilis]QFY42571.1 bifunctional tetrahydrofolate synthase/dihydrofolate synthase [Candidatus Methylospira mobilis]WNV04315.1 bifunctional tetrahydrofolate synthase/dihydrofolate synthase [Candidatus Methylospira mobilis]